MPFDPISLSEKRSNSSKYYKYISGLEPSSFATLGQITIFKMPSIILGFINNMQWKFKICLPILIQYSSTPYFSKNRDVK